MPLLVLPSVKKSFGFHPFDFTRMDLRRIKGSIEKNLDFTRMESKTFFYRGQNQKWLIFKGVKPY